MHLSSKLIDKFSLHVQPKCTLPEESRWMERMGVGGYKRTKSCKEGLTSLSRDRMNNYYVKGVGSWPKEELGKYFNWKPDQKRITQILKIVA